MSALIPKHNKARDCLFLTLANAKNAMGHAIYVSMARQICCQDILSWHLSRALITITDYIFTRYRRPLSLPSQFFSCYLKPFLFFDPLKFLIVWLVLNNTIKHRKWHQGFHNNFASECLPQ